ncbi:MAG: hypothetical protein IPL79_16405 [Myxococcales bacterium]|nr:hypothetical protein [Myxococcales bacterium]
MKNDRGWSDHEKAQLQRWKELSAEQRLRWLEEAKGFAHEAMQQAKKRRSQ